MLVVELMFSYRVLSANDPNVTNNIVLFHFGDREFKAIPPGSTDNTAFHLSLDGPMLHKVGFSSMICRFHHDNIIGF